MAGRSPGRLVAALLAVVLLASGCVSLRELLVGLPAEPTPTAVRQTAETRWVLVKNPRFGDVASEPEYIWVEENKIPWTFTRVLFGTSAVLAPAHIVAKYGPPPGGGKISPLQEGTLAATHAAAPGRAGPGSPGSAGPGARGIEKAAVAAKAEPLAGRGYVIFVDTDRVVTDLTAQDGLSPGTVVSVRRDRVPVIHPVTGEVLGELSEEVARGKVVEVRERFSVIEVQSVTPGAQIKVKDRVVPR